MEKNLLSHSLPGARQLCLINLLLAGLAGTAQAQTPTFTSLSTYGPATSDITYNFAVVDVNGDGKRDVVRTSDNNTISVLLGNGNGSFQTPSVFSLGVGAYSAVAVTVADVNVDNKSDLLTANFSSDNVSVLLGNGNGTFQAAQTYPIPSNASSPTDVAVADLNGDGKPDLLTANTNSDYVSILLGTGTGTFQTATSYSAGPSSGPAGVIAIDVNADGWLDVLTANFRSSTVGVLMGTGTGTFQTAQTYPAGSGGLPYNLAVADVNGDGKTDIVTANENSNTVGVLLGSNNGTFQAVQTYSTGASSAPNTVAVADVNGDGWRDLLTANRNGYAIGVLLGNGNGTFRTVQIFATGNSNQPAGIVAADVNGDGRPDMLFTCTGSSALGVLLNTTPLATRAALPGTSATLAPNPARASTTLGVAGLPPAARTVAATLHNALGQEVRRLLLPTTAGAAQAAVPTAGLPAGVYLLRLHVLDAQGGSLGGLPIQRLLVE